MSDYDEIIHQSAAIERSELTKEPAKPKTASDYFALGLATFGVGYIPLAPGTWGSLVGVLIYLLFAAIEEKTFAAFTPDGLGAARITAWLHAVNLILFLLFCLLGIWASSRATKIFRDKDPQKVVVDEVIGQLIVFLFVPFASDRFFVLAGFLLFRLFDIWKPYPIDSLQNLPVGIGVCADDILAGVYGGAVLSLLYAFKLTFF